MNLSELEKIMRESGISTCVVCGTPYTKRNRRQKTCGNPECQRTSHNEYLRERSRKLKEKDPEAFNKYHAIANKKWRDKKKALEARDEQLKELNTRWQKQSEFDKKVSEYGHRYGEVQAQKILESVPKIDVSLGKEKK